MPRLIRDTAHIILSPTLYYYTTLSHLPAPLRSTMLELTESRPAVYLLAFAAAVLAVSLLRPKKAAKAEKAEKTSPGGIDTRTHSCIHSIHD